MSSTSTHFEPSYAPSLTLFGSTGGCLLSTLKNLLLNPPTTSPEQQITLLVRSKEKLHTLLTSEPYNLPSALLTQDRLRILEGDVLTSPASVVLSAITTPPPGTQPGTQAQEVTGNISDVILFAIGGYPKATLIPPFFEMENPDICRSAMERVLDAVRTFGEIQAQSSSPQTTKKPLILAMSSTGLYQSSKEEPRDLPLPLFPLYKVLLRTPHKDKIAMEELLFSAATSLSSPSSSPQATPAALCDAIIVRGALFNSNPPSDPSLNPNFLKAGYANRKSSGTAPGKEREEEYGNEGNRYGDLSGPAIGYGVSRADVGWWIWEEIASGKRGWSREGVYKGEWIGKKVSLTN